MRRAPGTRPVPAWRSPCPVRRQAARGQLPCVSAQHEHPPADRGHVPRGRRDTASPDRYATLIEGILTRPRQTLEQVSTRIAFFIAGFVMAAWAPLVPFAKARAALNDGVLGLLLL